MTKLRLLIVDDEPELRELLSEELGDNDYDILTAPDGLAALTVVTEDPLPPDAVLSDINMPRMNGLELLAQVRQRKLDTPFVFLTGYGDKEKAVQALRLGAHDFLEKPYDRSLLQRIVADALQYGRQVRELSAQIQTVIKDGGEGAVELGRLQEAYRTIEKMKLRNVRPRKETV